MMSKFDRFWKIFKARSQFLREANDPRHKVKPRSAPTRRGNKRRPSRPR